MDEVRRLMQEGIESGTFPGGVVLAARDGKVRLHQAFGFTDYSKAQPVTVETFYDLASLTKPLVAASCVMGLVQDGAMDLNAPLDQWLPEFAGGDKRGATLARVLSHTAGFAAYRPYYRELALLPPSQRPERLVRLIADEPLAYRPGEDCIYSDLGFLALGRALERASGMSLDLLAAQRVFLPMGIGGLRFFPLHSPAGGEEGLVIAPTENCPWRKKVLCGEAHDDNAWVLGGVAGHAGLFGTALGVWQFLENLLASHEGAAPPGGFRPETVRTFLDARVSPGSHVLGYDTPTPPESSSGTCFSPRSVGHLGFTGASFWLDMDQNACVILLSNRVHPSRDNEKMRPFRPRLHDAVMHALGFSSVY